MMQTASTVDLLKDFALLFFRNFKTFTLKQEKRFFLQISGRKVQSLH